MKKIKVFIPVETGEDYDIKKDIAFRQMVEGKIQYGRAEEKEGYFFTKGELKAILSDAVEEGFLNNMSTKKYIESLNIK